MPLHINGTWSVEYPYGENISIILIYLINKKYFTYLICNKSIMYLEGNRKYHYDLRESKIFGGIK